MKNEPFHRRLRFALSGVKAALVREPSFRFQIMAGIGALAVLGLFRPGAEWWAIFIFMIGAVLASELLNTAIEAIVDLLHPEQHPLVAVAKDCAAAAVLVLSITSVVLFAIFLWQRLH